MSLATVLAADPDRCAQGFHLSQHPVEEWRSLAPRFPMYEVSNLGRVRSWRPYNRPILPYLMTATAAPNGYFYVKLVDADGKPCNPTLHSLVAHGFHGPRPDGMLIRHLDGNPENNDPANLRYGTASENMLDTVRHGTHREASKTHCKNGHPFTPENTRVEPRSGGSASRRCLTCQREYDQARYARKRR